MKQYIFLSDVSSTWFKRADVSRYSSSFSYRWLLTRNIMTLATEAEEAIRSLDASFQVFTSVGIRCHATSSHNWLVWEWCFSEL